MWLPAESSGLMKCVEERPLEMGVSSLSVLSWAFADTCSQTVKELSELSGVESARPSP